MAKSMVLKDRMNRPGGYAIASGEAIICCARVSAPARAVVFFADGSQSECDLINGKEQRIAAQGREMTGCCVICGEEAALSSDDAARSAYARRNMRQREGQGLGRQEKKEEETTKANEETRFELTQESKFKAEKTAQRIWPERRWPPPPCDGGLRYRQGSWQEEKARLRI